MTTETIVSASVLIQIPFYDVDMMEVAWHGHYVKYFEQARCALLDKIGYNYLAMQASGYAWPVVSLKIKYIKPLRFQQTIEVKACLVEYENRMKIEYQVLDHHTQAVLTKGSTTQLAIDLRDESLCFACPQAFTEKVLPYKENIL